MSVPTSPPVASPAPGALEDLKRRAARQAHGPYYGAQINVAAVVGCLLLAAMLAAVTAGFFALNARLTRLESGPLTAPRIEELVQQAIADSPGGGAITPEQVSALVEDRLQPLRQQLAEALESARTAQDTAAGASADSARALANPPVALFGKDAMLFVSKSNEELHRRLGALETAVFGPSSPAELAATVTEKAPPREGRTPAEP